MNMHTRPFVVLVLAFALSAVVAALLIWQDTPQKSAGLEQGSGIAVSDYRHLPAFTGVTLTGANEVLVRVGGPQSIVVRGDDNLVPFVSTTVRAGTLVIGTHGNFTTRARMSVELTVPELTSVTLRGSGDLRVTGAQGDVLAVSLPGTGNIFVEGSVGKADAVLSGTGQIDLLNLSSKDARATLDGTGQIVLQATHALHALLSGTGAIYYAGQPLLVDKNVTGTGIVAPT